MDWQANSIYQWNWADLEGSWRGPGRPNFLKLCFGPNFSKSFTKYKEVLLGIFYQKGPSKIKSYILQKRYF